MQDALALSLLHFLWQGAGLALVAWGLLQLTRSATVRYGIGVATLAAMLLAPAATFGVLVSQQSGAATPTMTTGARQESLSMSTRPAMSATASVSDQSRQAPSGPTWAVPTPWIVSLWFAGVLLLCVRLTGGWFIAQRLATSAIEPVSDEVRRLADAVSARLRLTQAVDVFTSSDVAVPVMIGWLRPVVLLPPAALAGLSLAQIEALLAHEFAHIRRHDYLVNLLQTVVETVCFYHPAVWWVSSVVRREREHCCDDLAVGVCDRLTYVTTLANLAAISSPRLALAATDGSLSDRVRRLIDTPTHSESAKGGWIAMLPILLVVSIAAPHALGLTSDAPQTTKPLPVVQEVKLEPVKLEPVQLPVVLTVKEVELKPVNLEPVEIKVATLEPVDLRAVAQVTEQEKARLEEMRVVREAERRVMAAELASVRREQAVSKRAREVELQRLDLELRRESARAELGIAELESELRLTETRMASLAERVKSGAASAQQQVEMVERLRLTKKQLDVARVEQEVAMQEMQLRRVEIERALKDTAEEAGHLVERLQDTRASRDLWVEEAALPETALDADARVEAGDRLRITVEGEPDLPTFYDVQTNGTIRMPLIGEIRVQNSTVAQVKAAVSTLLKDKGLVPNPVVAVSAYRRR